MSQLFTSDGQNIEASALASVLPVTSQGWFPLGLTGLLLQSKEHQFFSTQPSLWSNSHIHTTGNTIALTRWTFVGKVTSLLFKILSRFVTAFLSRSKHLLVSPSAVTIHSDFGAQENKICHCFHFFPIYLPWSDGIRCHDLSIECWVLSQLFHSPLSPSSRGSWVPLHFSFSHDYCSVFFLDTEIICCSVPTDGLSDHICISFLFFPGILFPGNTSVV